MKRYLSNILIDAALILAVLILVASLIVWAVFRPVKSERATVSPPYYHVLSMEDVNTEVN